jgi:hypothetical protein
LRGCDGFRRVQVQSMKTTQILGAISLLAFTASQEGLSAANSVLSLQSPGDYLTIGESASLHLTSAFTLEAWVNVSTFDPREQAVVAKPRIHYTPTTLLPLASQTCYALRINQGAVELALDNDAEVLRSANLSGVWDIQPNRWYHIAATYDGTSGRVYVGGVLKGSQSFSRSLDNDITHSLKDVPPLTIGGEILGPIPGSWMNSQFPLTENTHAFSGKIDEVRIWAKALTQDEIRTGMTVKLAGNEQGLRGYWNFDGGSGGQLVGAAKLLSGLAAFPSITLFADRYSYGSGYRFAIQAEPDLSYELETSANLSQWVSLGSVKPTCPSLVYVDGSATNFVNQRFYRAKRVP